VVPLSDPRIAAIPVQECGEPLVDVRITPLRMDPRQADPTGAHAHLRCGVVDRLVTAQSLLPRGIQLLIIEGYRPLATQERYFQEYRDQLQRAQPDWLAATLDEEASRYISPPHVAPHVAGAAVDLTLCGDDGIELPMGSSVNATPEESVGRCYSASVDITPLARCNRNMLDAVLRAVCLVNYPSEWWHWSYGDRYWAFMSGATTARYGPIAALDIAGENL
jgi:D-alanyl-D-alanine dipeptidase